MAGLLVKLAIMIGILVVKCQCIEISHWGNYFVFTFLQCSKGNAGTSVNNIIVITTRNVSSNINIMRMETNETWEVSLAPFEEYKLNLNSTVTAFPFGEILPRKAVVVMASTKVSVYGFSEQGSSVDGFLVIPVAGLGDEYRTVSPATHGQSGPQIAVVAVEDETEVSIKFTGNNVCIFKGSTRSVNNGDLITFTMDAYDVMNLNCSSDTTGSLVQSSKAVAVLSGSIAIPIPISAYPNHVVEMMPPTKDYHSEFVLQAPTGTDYASMYRVIFHVDSTYLFIGSYPSGSSGQYLDFVIDQNDKQPFCLLASEHVLVVLFHVGKDSTKNIGDAYMSIIPPSEKYGNYYVVPYSVIANATDTLAITVYTEHKQLLVPQSSPYDQVKDCEDYLDAVVMTLPDVSHIDSALYYSVATFSVILYGYNVKFGYGFPAGFNVTDNSGVEECTSSPCLNNDWCIETSLSFRCYSPSVRLTTTGVPTTTTPITTTTVTTTDNNPSTFQTTTANLSTTESVSSASPESTISITGTVNNTQLSSTNNELTTSPISTTQSADTNAQTTTGEVTTSTTIEVSTSSASPTYRQTTRSTTTPSNSSTESNLTTTQNQNSTIYPETTNSTTTPISQSGSMYSMCQCPCVNQVNDGIFLNNSVEQLSQILNKQNLSKTRRRKTSAENITQVEKDLGASSFLIIMTLCSVVVISDLMRLLDWIKRFNRNS